MKYYEEAVVPEKKYKKLIKTTCDLCNKVIDDTGEEVEINAIENITNWHKRRYEVDMCIKCFTWDFKNWVETFGSKIKESEVDD